MQKDIPHFLDWDRFADREHGGYIEALARDF